MTVIPDNAKITDEPMIFIIIGKASETDGDTKGVDIHVMLRAPDDDSAVRETLNALAEEGFLEADLEQIGILGDIPNEEPHASAYRSALAGEVSIIKLSN